ncbi:response regulator [Flavobacterium pallidum]|uniref:Response regulator n=1 Tax=Flavobacterium pallidum TaxID=2172098 RepID=A0A2S1SDX3_9FLAO|nr:response regulator [Flavobacterium pallidum]AWI24589.1 response regulator [Flavobacterium pallidum]
MGDKPLRIILAEDDGDDRLLFGEALHELGKNVHLVVADNGIKLMEILNGMDELPLMVFTDLNMPLKDGIDAVRDIRNEERFKTLPVVVFSTSYDVAVAEKLRQLGATNYFLKPNAFNDLKSVIGLAIDIVTDPETSTSTSFVLNA